MRGVIRSVNTFLLLAVCCAAGSIEIRTAELPRAIKGVSYRADIDVRGDGRCPIGDFHVALASGTLPRGLEVEFGAVAGTAKEMGLFPFELRAWNGCSE